MNLRPSFRGENFVPTAGARGTKNESPPRIPDHELIRRIGAGAYGVVWLARNVLGGFRAVKAVHRSSFKTEEPYEREFRGIQRFEPISRSNDGLVDVLQVGRNEAQGCFYYVMELADDASGDREHSAGVAGRKPGQDPALAAYSPKTLGSEVQRCGRLPPGECVRLGLSLSLALAHLHRHGLIHRDVKPSNIIFVGGIPKLADIGLVTDLSDAQSFVGTEGFIPPEGPNTPQADIYSLGKVLYEISMGKDRKHFPEPGTALGDSADSDELEELNAVILKACAANPVERYQTAEELHADLALLNSGKSVKWKRVVERRLSWAKRIASAAAVAALLATAGYLFQRQQTREAQRNLYAANMNLAQRDWDKANIERLEQLLQETASYPGKGFEWHYWKRQLHLDVKTLRAHSDSIKSAAFSPDGQRLATASADHAAIIWDFPRGAPSTVLKGHTAAVTSIAYSPDGARIATASHDRTVRIWDASDGRQIASLSHTGPVFAIAISPDGRHIATAARFLNRRAHLEIALWDAASWQKLRVLGQSVTNGHGVSGIAFSRTGQRMAAITDRWLVQVWDTASGRQLSVCKSPGSEFYSLSLTADGERLVTGSNEAIVWNATTGEPLFTLPNGNQRGIWAVAYSPDGKAIITAGGDQRVIVWDAEQGEERLRLAGHHRMIESIAVSPDGNYIVTGSADATAKIWNARALPNPRTLVTPSRDITMLAYSPDHTRLAAMDSVGAVRLLDAAAGRELLVLTGDVRTVQHIAFSPDGRRMALAGNARGSNAISKILEAATGRELVAVQGHGFVAFSSDGRRIATASGSGAIISDALTGSKLMTLGDNDRMRASAFSPDGKRLATIGSGRTSNAGPARVIKIWNADTGRELSAIECGRGDFVASASITFSPDGKHIAVVDGERTAKVWNARTGRVSFELRGHLGAVAGVAFSPDGRRIVTVGHDRSAKVWDALTGRELLTLEGHTKALRTVAVAPDGRSIATAGNGGVIKIWESAEQPPAH